MISKIKMIKFAELINKLLIENKLYTSNNIIKLLRENIDEKITRDNVYSALRYAKSNNLIHTDRIGYVSYYWKKIDRVTSIKNSLDNLFDNGLVGK